ncbi:hypothetical protein [Tabrizicola sp.]|uniref:hypothetical protein n=1 Tax=Tabrizicola sp. TaxID=2005166 RepID=UPI00286B3F6C|nr:hypothetical protein [Tabrizicola sp.]
MRRIFIDLVPSGVPRVCLQICATCQLVECAIKLAAIPDTPTVDAFWRWHAPIRNQGIEF